MLHDDVVDPSFRSVYGAEHPPTGELVIYGGDPEPLRTTPWILWSTGWLALTPEAERRTEIEVPLLLHLPEELHAATVRPCCQLADSLDGNASMPRVLGSALSSAGLTLLHERIPLNGWRLVRFGLLVTRFTGEQTHPNAHLHVPSNPFLRALESAPSES